ncbi:hypothetical protein Poli38472_003307 [Pythium oligandrum]|uniref:Cilia- and flagella-associated protein 91 n=1 Tax=Pythium oligandrum TaxID=41045 RepID=A0A8K1C6D7_PYTOL|nr:hypothetical protein Poli38472_003307 [Pythium oligandrum]|eukprot:TMW57382.1 hypothetical protein Poli38472_003307 [Pythium oligandrum]
MSRAAPSRPLDAVYDPVYTISHSHGSYRKTAVRAASSTKASISNNNHAGVEGYAHVSGKERVKYSQRPVLPHLHAESPEVLLAPVPVPSNVKKRSQDEDMAPTRSIGIQTMYRDSEAQTDPYTPDYTIKKSLAGQKDTETPEVLSLVHLRHAQGLPAGRAEIEMIERNRKKKAFEASLPPMTDEASFLLRKSMLETQETREWAYREAEIDALHEQRIALLQQALEERDKENEFLAEQRLEALRQRLVHEKENAMERIQQERVVALRKLTKKRQHGHVTSPRRELKRDIINEYTDFGSHVYAPVTRAGKSGKSDIKEVGIEKDQYLQLETLHDFETRIPSKLLTSTKQKPATKVVKTAKDRRQATIEAHLLKMESIIKKSKEHSEEHGATGSASPTSSLVSRKRAQQQQQQLLMTRPPTPDYGQHNDDADDELHDAVRLLQKLLRGRAVQNMIFDGKERRAELIQELRASDAAAKWDAESAHNVAAAVAEDEQRVVTSTMRKAEGEVISEMLDFLYKELDRSKEVTKVRAFVERASEERRRREVEEGGRRQAEDMLRDREDEVFRRIERVHQETAMDYIDDMLHSVIQEQAQNTAMCELQVFTGALGPMVTTLENLGNSDELIVKDLVASFLLPQVQRQQVRDQLAQEEKKYVTAAHAMLTEMVNRMQE